MSDASQPLEGATDSKLLELIGDVIGLLEIDEFRHGLLAALGRAVPADWIALNDIGPDPESILVIIEPAASPALFEKFRQFADENPLIQRYAQTRDGRATRFSDVVTTAGLHSLNVYKQLYRPMGVEFQIAFTLPTAPDRLLGVALSRGDRDFSDAERDLLNLARPFLAQAHRNALQHSELFTANLGSRRSQPAPDLERLVGLGLTERQARVLKLLATGASDRDIASLLQISPRTVQKHVERCYRTLGVKGRAEATAAAWATLETVEAKERIHRPSVLPREEPQSSETSER